MNKREVYRYLGDRNVRYEVTEHEAVYHMAEAAAVPLPFRRRRPKTCLCGMIKNETII